MQNNTRMRNRELKARIGQLLGQDPFENALEILGRISGRRAVNPLFSFLYSGNERTRWRAVTAMGTVVGNLADADMESARVVMRRLMWNLNDESGGIGWGSPEAMGEITAGHEALANEFAAIVVSFINPDGNFLEHPLLQRGSLWGVGRLAHARPLLAKPAALHLGAFFQAPDPHLRGLAIWAAGPILGNRLRPLVMDRLSDHAPLQIYRRMQMVPTTVAELAESALSGRGW
ncbi:MAG: hypothetical protein R6W95_16420 [Desulfosarcina sp.]